MNKIPIEVSARHMHLSKSDLEKLFGRGYELKKLKDLSQPGEFAAEESVDIEGPKGKIEKVRIIGPIRKNTQVEISKTDGYKIGTMPPVRVSGNIKDTPGIKLIGPEGEVELAEGLIAAQRHIHMTSADADKFVVQNLQIVSVKVEGERGLVYNNVICRVRDNFQLSFQIDTDEANAGGVKNLDIGELIV